jgi:HEAT repeat protein
MGALGTMETIDRGDAAKTSIAGAAIKQFNMALKSLHLYPADHKFCREIIGELLSRLRDFFKPYGPLELRIENDAILLGDRQVNAGTGLARQLFQLKVELLSFGPYVDERQLAAFLKILCMDVNEVAQAGGIVELLWQNQIEDITISQATVKRTFEAFNSEDDTVPVPDFTELKQLLFKENELSRAERSRLRQGLFDGAEHLSSFLLYVCGEGDASDQAARIVTGVLPRFASLARYDTLDDRNYFFRIVAEALLLLNPDLRVETTEKLLSAESASATIARRSVFEQLTSREISALLRDSIKRHSACQTKIVDTLKALPFNENHLRELVHFLMEELALEDSVEAGLIDLMNSRAANIALDPWRRQPGEAQRLAGIIASLPEADIDAIRSEAAKIESNALETSAIATVAELLRIETDTECFTGVTDGLSKCFKDALDQERLPAGIAVLDCLVNELRRRFRDTEKAAAIRKVLADAGRSERISVLIKWLENDPAGRFPEAENYLSLLGNFGIQSLLEILAAEDSAGRRRLICRLLVSCSRQNLSCLGSKMMDHRWYVVRNVASILGEIGDAGGINYLREAVRHTDPRVRLETARALSRLGPNAIDPLKILAEDSEKNIRLEAIGALGCIGNPASAPILADIANRRDLLNRTLEYKLAAIEALGNMRDRAALPALLRLVGGRPTSPGNAVTEAAQAAIEKIQKQAPEKAD